MSFRTVFLYSQLKVQLLVTVSDYVIFTTVPHREVLELVGNISLLTSIYFTEISMDYGTIDFLTVYISFKFVLYDTEKI